MAATTPRLRRMPKDMSEYEQDVWHVYIQMFNETMPCVGKPDENDIANARVRINSSNGYDFEKFCKYCNGYFPVRDSNGPGGHFIANGGYGFLDSKIRYLKITNECKLKRTDTNHKLVAKSVKKIEQLLVIVSSAIGADKIISEATQAKANFDKSLLEEFKKLQIDYITADSPEAREKIMKKMANVGTYQPVDKTGMCKPVFFILERVTDMKKITNELLLGMKCGMNQIWPKNYAETFGETCGKKSFSQVLLNDGWLSLAGEDNKIIDNIPKKCMNLSNHNSSRHLILGICLKNDT